MNIFYVYKHTFSDGSFYLGKGAGGRSHQFTTGRSSVYMELLKRFGAPKVEILHKDMQEDEAYDIENKLILKSRKESAKIINRTDGLERANVGVMPPQTLIFYDSSKNTHPKYKQRVHLKNIKQYIRGEGGDIVMEDGKNIALSRNKKSEFLGLFNKI